MWNVCLNKQYLPNQWFVAWTRSEEWRHSKSNMNTLLLFKFMFICIQSRIILFSSPLFLPLNNLELKVLNIISSRIKINSNWCLFELCVRDFCISYFFLPCFGNLNLVLYLSGCCGKKKRKTRKVAISGSQSMWN